jgi:hypothetical protein
LVHPLFHQETPISGRALAISRKALLEIATPPRSLPARSDVSLAGAARSGAEAIHRGGAPEKHHPTRTSRAVMWKGQKEVSIWL